MKRFFICPKHRLNSCKLALAIKLFLDMKPMIYISIEILEGFLKTHWWNKSFTMFFQKFSKLLRTVLKVFVLIQIMTETFKVLCVLTYHPLAKVELDTERLLVTQSSTEVCNLLCNQTLNTLPKHPPENILINCFKQTFFVAIKIYGAENHCNWDALNDAPTCRDSA